MGTEKNKTDFVESTTNTSTQEPSIDYATYINYMKSLNFSLPSELISLKQRTKGPALKDVKEEINVYTPQYLDSITSPGKYAYNTISRPGKGANWVTAARIPVISPLFRDTSKGINMAMLNKTFNKVRTGLYNQYVQNKPIPGEKMTVRDVKDPMYLDGYVDDPNVHIMKEFVVTPKGSYLPTRAQSYALNIGRVNDAQEDAYKTNVKVAQENFANTYGQSIMDLATLGVMASNLNFFNKAGKEVADVAKTYSNITKSNPWINAADKSFWGAEGLKGLLEDRNNIGNTIDHIAYGDVSPEDAATVGNAFINASMIPGTKYFKYFK